MDDPTGTLAEGRRAYRNREWPTAYRHLTAVRQHRPLAPDDLAALSDSAWWLGRVAEAISVGEGRVVVRQGRVAEGMALLDEAMLPAVDGTLTPDFAGNDARRRASWTVISPNPAPDDPMDSLYAARSA